jgi:hypothetical protein
MARPTGHARHQTMTDDRLVGDVKRVFDDVGGLAERLRRGRFAESMQPLAAGAAKDPVVGATRRARARRGGKGGDLSLIKNRSGRRKSKCI